MTKKELVEKIAHDTGMNTREVLLVVEGMMEGIKKQLVAGENVYLRGFGSFVAKKREEKIARNVKQNTRLYVPAHYTPIFKPSKVFKEAVKKLPVDE